MRRPLLVLFILAVAAGVSAAREPKKWTPGPFAEARQRLLRGNYEEARSAYEELARKDSKLAPRAAVGVSQTYRLVGEYDKAVATLTDALKATPDSADLLAARADLLADLGRWDEAVKDAEAALKKQDDQLLARWTLARLYRDTGKLAEADDANRWIVRYYTRRNNADDDITDPEELLQVARAGLENAKLHKSPAQIRFVLNEVIKDALTSDPDFWPAEQFAGTLLLEKYNRPDALDAFDKALKINPKAADAMVGKGEAALQKYELKEAEVYADQALKVNPRHPGALRLKAEVYLVGNDYPTAEKLLRQAKTVNPRDPHTLGKLAGCFLVQKKAAEFDATVKEAEASDAKPAVFYTELAGSLDDRKRYAQAETYFRKAAELRPQLPTSLNSLGMLYLRLGKESEGRDLLKKGFEADPFNVRVANSIKVMKHLDGYATLSTDHYVIRYDPKSDKVLAEFLAEYLEETHAELKRQFGYEPPGKIPFEVFNSHEMFSGRTVALPDLHTIGASTGKIVTMASPHAKGVSKPFNWGRVVRHELTHVFNLIQTDFLCPHWLTEGLAVRNEQMARPPLWTTILRDKLDKDELFTLDTVMLGFVRPKGPEEWTLAYCQSQLYVDYLTRTHGEACVGKLLDAYRDGMDTAVALKAACGADKAAFEKGYRAYVEDVVKPYRTKPKTEEKQLTFEQLQEEHKKNPADADVAARLADQYFRRDKAADARKLVEAALVKKPGHPLASIVKARLLSRGGDEAGARAALSEALKANPDDARLLLSFGRMMIESKNYDAAAAAYEHGRRVAPLDGDWLEQLARLYKLTGEKEKRIEVLKELAAHDPDELEARIQLARAALDAGKPADAERFAKDALRIDVLSEEARKVLIEALKGQNKTDEVEKMLKRFGT